MYSADRLRRAGHGTLLSEGRGYRRAANHGNTAADGDAPTYCHARTGRYAGNTGGTDPDRDGSPGRGRRHRALYADLDAAGKDRPALFHPSGRARSNADAGTDQLLGNRGRENAHGRYARGARGVPGRRRCDLRKKYLRPRNAPRVHRTAARRDNGAAAPRRGRGGRACCAACQ